MDHEKIEKSEREWRVELTPQQYAIMRQKKTEHPFTGELVNEKRAGKYSCAACGWELFDSEAKFDSGTGWPSFIAEKEGSGIVKQKDLSLGKEREEIVCPRCGGHLGHLFDDGPAPTGKRYCVNSAALCFNKKVNNNEDNDVI